MNTRKPNKLKSSLRQRFSRRQVVVAASSILMLTVAVFTYIQLSQTTSTKAGTQPAITRESLPVDFVIPEMIVAPADTNMRNGMQYKVAKPLPATNTGI